MVWTGRDHDGSEELIRSEYDWTTSDPSTAVVEAIALVEDTDPVALSRAQEITPSDSVDPDALDRLVARCTESGLRCTETGGRYRSLSVAIRSGSTETG
ncbi:hypothetical protein BRC81_08715 [Halobacteriales archaeon QS_1_68_20]|nr:MAG: hypothetical protein BRC81_08715 [Halobacteriales archaeon QS_1_68_20]